MTAKGDLTATKQPLIFVLGYEPAWPQPDADSGRMRHLGDSLDQHPSNRDTPLIADGDPDNSAILEWDVSAIPAGSTVLRAWITLNVQNTSAESYDIYPMKRAWVESQANWSNYSSGGSWQVAEASGPEDRGSTSLGRVSARSDYGNTYILSLNEDGIALIQSWIDNPAANHGVILTDYGRSDSVRFDSRESATAGHRPKLTAYVMAGGIPPLVPATGTIARLLLVLALGASLVGTKAGRTALSMPCKD